MPFGTAEYQGEESNEVSTKELGCGSCKERGNDSLAAVVIVATAADAATTVARLAARRREPIAVVAAPITVNESTCSQEPGHSGVHAI